MPSNEKANDYTGWKTFSDTELAFEFKYPGEWELNKYTSPSVQIIQEELPTPYSDQNYHFSLTSPDKDFNFRISYDLLSQEYLSRMKTTPYKGTINGKDVEFVKVNAIGFAGSVNGKGYYASQGDLWANFDNSILPISDLLIKESAFHMRYRIDREQEAIEYFRKIIATFKPLPANNENLLYNNKKIGIAFYYPPTTHVFEEDKPGVYHLEVRSLIERKIVFDLYVSKINRENGILDSLMSPCGTVCLYYNGPFLADLTFDSVPSPFVPDFMERLSINSIEATKLLYSTWNSSSDDYRISEVYVMPSKAKSYDFITIYGPKLKYTMDNGKYDIQRPDEAGDLILANTFDEILNSLKID